jgi:hypothetical protein
MLAPLSLWRLPLNTSQDRRFASNDCDQWLAFEFPHHNTLQLGAVLHGSIREQGDHTMWTFGLCLCCSYVAPLAKLFEFLLVPLLAAEPPFVALLCRCAKRHFCIGVAVVVLLLG